MCVVVFVGTLRRLLIHYVEVALWLVLCIPACVCVCVFVCRHIFFSVSCVHVPLSMCSSTGSKEACYSDLWLMSSVGQQVRMCV